MIKNLGKNNKKEFVSDDEADKEDFEDQQLFFGSMNDEEKFIDDLSGYYYNEFNSYIDDVLL